MASVGAYQTVGVLTHEYDPTDIDGNIKRAQAKKDLDDQASAQDRQDLKWLMSHAAGRRIFWGLLARCGEHNTSLRHSNTLMAHAAGMRDVALWLKSRVATVCPERWIEVQKEHMQDD